MQKIVVVLFCVMAFMSFTSGLSSSVFITNTGLHNNMAAFVPEITDTPVMVFVKGGPFIMGCENEQNIDCRANEKPAHKVSVSDYYIGRFDVSVAQFEEFVRDLNYETDADKAGTSLIYVDYGWQEIKGINWKYDAQGKLVKDADKKHYPVVHVSHNDAYAYCQWLSLKTGKQCRMPTEAEWEYAAKGGSKSKATKYAGSNELDEVGWYLNNSNGLIHPMGLKKANELGIFDMSGNVYQWCADLYAEDYYQRVEPDNPKGPKTGNDYVLRGGSWLNKPNNERCSFRHKNRPNAHNGMDGFRIVMQIN